MTHLNELSKVYNESIAEAMTPEQRKVAQEILDKETGADKKKAVAAAKKERSEIRKEKELRGIKGGAIEELGGDFKAEEKRLDAEVTRTQALENVSLEFSQRGLNASFAQLGKEIKATTAGTKGLTVEQVIIQRDFPIMILTVLACMPIFWTKGKISRSEGALLLTLYLFYLSDQHMLQLSHQPRNLIAQLMEG